MENSKLVNALGDLVNKLEEIKDPFFSNLYDYATANELLQKAKMYAETYFPLKHYNTELIFIKFEPELGNDNNKREWNKGMIKLLSITKAMYENSIIIPAPVKVFENTSKIKELNDEIKIFQENLLIQKDKYLKIIENQKKELTALVSKFDKFKRFVLFIILLFVLSIILWGFNFFVKWHWLSVHPKKAALYISFQILILFSLLRIISTNKAIKIVDIILAVVIAILTII